MAVFHPSIRQLGPIRARGVHLVLKVAYDAGYPATSLCCAPHRLQHRKAEWAARGHGEVQEVEEKEFFKVRKVQSMIRDYCCIPTELPCQHGGCLLLMSVLEAAASVLAQGDESRLCRTCAAQAVHLRSFLL